MTERLYIYNQQSRITHGFRLRLPWVVIHAKDYRGPSELHDFYNPAYGKGAQQLDRFQTLAEAMDFAVKHVNEVP